MAKSGVASGQGSARSQATRTALIQAAIDTVGAEGFTGASARAIAERAGCNQALVFYHFDSVVGLLLAALDEISARRLDQYQAVVDAATSPVQLVEAAAGIFGEDLDAGYVTFLAQMIAGASSTPGLGAEVSARLAPWKDFARRAVETALSGTPLASLVPAADAAHGVVALYLGLEMLSHLDGDRASALALFDQAGRLAGLAQTLGLPQNLRLLGSPEPRS
jgi:AcrR family transcriptional regulator